VLKNKNGQALVEFALMAMLFFLILFAIVDFGVMFYVNLTMQHAVREGTRYAVTGQSDLGADRRSALLQKIKNSSNGLYDKNLHVPKDPTIKVISPSNVTFANYTSGTVQSGDPGKPNDVVVVSLTYTWPLITPVLKPFFRGGQYTFTVKSTMKNESFPTP
jgi:Flp pilus assembly protein TadG